MKVNQVIKIFMLIAIGMVLASCNTGSQANPTAAVDVVATLSAVQTQSADAIKAVENNAMATLGAAQTQMAATLAAQAAQPTEAPATEAPVATAEPTLAPTAAPTTVVVVPTTAPTAKPTTGPTATPSAFACSIVSVSPALNTSVTPGYDFDMVWVVKNVGSSAWSKDEVDFRYSSGTKFQKFTDGFDLTETVDSGKTITLAVDMMAPHEKGHYTATWVVVKGNTTICTLTTDITVK